MYLSQRDYTVGCICPVGVELGPVKAMLDAIHTSLPVQRDQNSYLLGEMRGHNVVIAMLPEGRTNMVATVTTQLLADFPYIRFGLLVGVGSGIPDQEGGGHDVRLGDVVISKPTANFGGVVQYGLGNHSTVGGFERIGELNTPPQLLQASVSTLAADRQMRGSQVPQYLREMLQQSPAMEREYSRPGAQHDQLFRADYPHSGGLSCRNCDQQQTVERNTRPDKNPRFHYGTIGSANIVVKDAVMRKELRRSLSIICVEVQAAGLLDSFPCLLVRGICDYADSHTNKRWHPYAAAAAAAYMKEFLSVISPADVAKMSLAADMVQMSSPSFRVPFRRNINFVDRGALHGGETLLEQIEHRFAAAAATVALLGVGGIGKTELAREYCHRLRARSPSTWVFWICASNIDRIKQGYHEMAQRIQIPGRNNPQANIFKLVATWLQDEKNGEWLLVLDSLDDDAALYAPRMIVAGTKLHGALDQPGHSLSAYLPQSQNGGVLVTSRSRSVATELVDSQNIIAVNGMTEHDALALFKEKSEVIDEDGDLEELVRVLEYHPLAIELAAAYIRLRGPKFNVRQYIEAMHDVQISSPIYRNTHPIWLTSQPGKSVFGAWQIALDEILKKWPSLSNLLCLMSFFDAQGIPEELLKVPTQKAKELYTKEQAGESDGEDGRDNDKDGKAPTESNSDFDFKEDMKRLEAYGFVSCGIDGRTFKIHRMVRPAAHQRLKMRGEFEMWRSQSCKNLNTVFPTGEYENWGRYERLHPHVKKVELQRPVDDESVRDWAQILRKAGWFACAKGDYHEAERMCGKSTEALTEVLGREDIETSHSLGMLATVYRHQGRWSEAARIGAQVMITRRKMLGEEHPETLNGMVELALTYRNLGGWNQAEALLRSAMMMMRRVLGEEHRDTLSCMASLASTCSDRGQWKEAEQLDRVVMETRRRVLEEEHPDIFDSMDSLGSILWNQGKWMEAEVLQEKVIEKRRRVQGEEHPATLSSMARLAFLYQEQGRWEDTEELLVSVIETRKRLLGAEHPDTLSSMANLASIYRSQDRLEKAEKLEETIPEARERVQLPTQIFEDRYIRARSLEQLCSQLFGANNNWIVTFKSGHIVLQAPRNLTEEEIHWCSDYQLWSQTRVPAPDPADVHPIAPERSFDRCQNKQEIDLNSIPLVDSRSSQDIRIPMRPTLANGSPADQYLIFKIDDEINTGDQRDAAQLSAVYGRRVAAGQTCHVEVVETTMIWLSGQLGTSKGITLKLSQGTPPGHFIHELNMLRQNCHKDHPNIIQAMAVFREERSQIQHFNFVFPLALGSLKQLLRGQIAQEDIQAPLQTLWFQFEGLASALSFLHSECQTVHRDIKPSNILLFSTMTKGRSLLNAKVSDFGLATNLSGATTWTHGTKEANSAWTYDAPELRQAMSSSDGAFQTHSLGLLAGDVWKLGVVFLELITYVNLGSPGIEEFRSFITTNEGRVVSDNVSPARFDDGIKVKGEVVEWIHKISCTDSRARLLEPLVLSMLGPAEDRPSARKVWDHLLESPLTLYCEGPRLIQFSRSTIEAASPDPSILSMVAKDGVRTAAQMVWKHISRNHLGTSHRPARHIDHSSQETITSPSSADLVKFQVEKWLAAPVDWWPFSAPQRKCPAGHIRVSWKWSKRRLFVDLPRSISDEYRRLSCKPLSHAPSPGHASQSLPGYQQPGQQSSASASQSTTPIPVSGKNLQSQPPPPILTHLPLNSSLQNGQPAVNIKKEMYWCVNKAWSETKISILDRICGDRHPQDDEALCKSLREAYNHTRGVMGRYLSWRTCGSIRFIHFCVKFNRLHEITCIAEDRLPYSPGYKTVDKYDYQLSEPEEAHVKLAAEQLVAGMYRPHCIERGTSDTLNMVPQRFNETLKLSKGEHGWGLQAVEIWSLTKVVRSLVLLALTSFGFAIWWLNRVKENDLQNAFVPGTLLLTTFVILLAVPQLLTSA